MQNDDLILPVYCKRCHKQTPDAELSQNNGICTNCSIEIARIKTQEAQTAQAERERIYNINTGKGACLQCKSKNIYEYQRDAGGGNSLIAPASCCCGCLFFLPLAFLAPFLGTKPVTERIHHCNACGYEWRV